MEIKKKTKFKKISIQNTPEIAFVVHTLPGNIFRYNPESLLVCDCQIPLLRVNGKNSIRYFCAIFRLMVNKTI